MRAFWNLEADSDIQAPDGIRYEGELALDASGDEEEEDNAADPTEAAVQKPTRCTRSSRSVLLAIG
jgi:hypothetical protein